MKKEEILKLGRSGLIKSSSCTYCTDCSSCTDCTDCRSCTDCFMCSVKENESYMVKNVQLTKEEYETFMRS
jgi:hypothetical protein